jgi:hypothetical protein
MKNLLFIWRERSSLVECLRQPFNRLSVKLDVIQRPMAVQLCHGQATPLEIRSKMFAVAQRTEVGVLEFSTNETQFDNELGVDIVDSWGAVVAIEKLVIETHEVRAESGLAFKNVRNEEIVIVSGAQPYGLAIKVPWEATLPKFSPEYSLDEYQRVPMGKLQS